MLSWLSPLNKKQQSVRLLFFIRQINYIFLLYLEYRRAPTTNNNKKSIPAIAAKK